MLTIRYHAGTLELKGHIDPALLPSNARWDERSQCHRAPAADYAQLMLALVRAKVEYKDEARAYEVLQGGLVTHKTARPYQRAALEAWNRNLGRGVVVLPTGAGKSHVACMAIDAKRRSSLVVAPTLDLVFQWYELLRANFAQPVGVVGGGDYSVLPLTVTTYDSAWMQMEHLGKRFGMIIFDECHHLPGESYSLAARFSLAPYRLGLTATPERSDGRHQDLDQLIGPMVYERRITELKGRYLADYETERIEVELTAEERDTYLHERSIYRHFLVSQGIRMSAPDGWTQFIIRSSRTVEGRRAMQAYRKQKEIAFAAPSKLRYLDHLLMRHRRDRTLLFTQNNAAAYQISRRFLVPVITHQTPVTERGAILDGLKNGTYNAIVTSKVLNEGVDVPSANVAIIVSGSGSVREHVQRLGRILRKDGEKRALLYELVASDTNETHTSNRRRVHDAYDGKKEE